MNDATRKLLRKELDSRGFGPDGYAPNGTVWLTDSHAGSVDIVELLDTMVVRREKVFWSVNTVGHDVARKGYDDVVLLIDAIKAVIRGFCPP